jgi:LPXTG-motif cell wall-anchored protein
VCAKVLGIFVALIGKEALIMDTSTLVRVIAGALAVIVLAVIIIRRKKKSA